MVNQRLKGGFGPSRRVCKPAKRKSRSKIMKKSLTELKVTKQYYMVSVPKRHNNVNVSQEKGKTRKMPQITLERSPSDRLKNGLFSSMKKNEAKVSSSRLNNRALYLTRNTDKSMAPPSPKNSYSRSNDGLCSLAKKMKGSRASSQNIEKSRAFACPNNGSSRPKKTDKSRAYFSGLNNGAMSVGENTEKSRASSSWTNNGAVSSAKNAEKSRPYWSRWKDGMISSVKNIKKSRPSRFSDGLALGKLARSMDDPNSTVRVSKKSLPLKEVMPADMTKNVDMKDQCNNLGSMSKGLLDPNQGKGIAARNDGFEVSKFTKSKVVSTLTNLTMVDKNKCNRVDLSSVERDMGSEVCKENLCKAMEAPNSSFALKGSQVRQHVQRISGNDSFFIAKELSSHQLTEESPKGCINLDSKSQNTSLVEDDIISDDVLKRKRIVGLLVEKPVTHDDDDSEEDVPCRPKKKRRKYIDNEYEKEDGNDENVAAVEGVTAGLTTQNAIDEPIWSGIFKIGRKEYVSMAAHLSPKSCEKVWEFSRSLRPVVEVTKLSRWEAWPKGFLASNPADDNNALFFLPLEMRTNDDMDQLVKEVIENDMVLRADVGEAEMLIFPSILLPEQPQTFKSKPYLWGVFRPREDNVDVVEEHRGTGGCARDEEMGKQDVSQQHVVKEGTRVAGLNMDCGIQAPEQVERQHIEKDPTPSLAVNPAEGATRPTTAAEMSANHVQINSSLGVPTGAVFAFVAGETPRLKELIQEMKGEGALVIAMRGGDDRVWSLPDNSDSVGRRTRGLGSSHCVAMVYGDPWWS